MKTEGRPNDIMQQMQACTLQAVHKLNTRQDLCHITEISESVSRQVTALTYRVNKSQVTEKTNLKVN